MRSRHRQAYLTLFVLGVLAILTATSFLKAQPTNKKLSPRDRFPASQRAPLLPSAALEESFAQVRADGPVLVNADLVTLTVSVLDGDGRTVTGLDKRAFTILDEKSTQEITFFSDADAPVSISIVFDLSGSMSGEKIKRAREALAHFIETSLDSDEYSLIAFNEKPQLLLERTRDAKAILDRLSAAVPHGATALYDACYLGVDRLTHGVYPKRALLLISDGQDNNSHYNLDQVRHLLRESDVELYSIGIADPIQLHGKAGAQMRAALQGLAGPTGGKTFYPSNSAEMDEAFEQIALELRHQYSIGYRPRNFTGDGKWHRIKVKVTMPAGTRHRSVHTKEGYYAVAR
jgi:Ca-activated chloride channel family protein